jgi:hypothetical protein
VSEYEVVHMSSIPLHGHRWPASGLFHRRTATDAGKHSDPFVATLDDHERVLFRSKAGAAMTVVGTDRAVHYRTADSAWRQIPWIDVVAAARSQLDGATILQLWPDAASTAVTLAAEGRFAEFAAERIAHVRVICRRIAVTPRVAGAVEAVRLAGSEALTWRVHLDNPADGDNPLVASECARVVTELRSLCGC